MVYVKISYLKERELVLELWVWRIRIVGHHREVLEQTFAGQARGVLEDQLATLHCLAIPEWRAILSSVRLPRESAKMQST